MIKKRFIAAILITIFLSGCGVYNSLMNLSKLKFKLGEINNFKVSNISISSKSKLSDFGTLDIVNLTSDVVSGKFPVTFTINVLAKNPNPKSSSGNDLSKISLDSFPWTLYINDKETISGNISKPVIVPTDSGSTIIPLDMKLDMMNFFKDDGLNDLIKLALKLGGSKGSSSNIKIVAEPVLGTTLGSLKYPEPITIIDETFK